MPFPIDVINERAFEPGWTGELFICDIDRTYLYTRFSSLKGITRIPLEFAIDKQDIEGMAVLLREVRRGPQKQSRHTPLYFVSASPAQLREVIQRKMLLDGLEFDGTIFKDWLGVLSSLRFKRFKEQLGFKVTAMLHLLLQLPAGIQVVLMGDDLETDALAFSLLADAVAGRLDEQQIRHVLRDSSVAHDDARAICELVSQNAGRGTTVRRALIRLERHASPEDFLEFWPFAAVCRGALQMALGLWSQGSISDAGVIKVAGDLTSRGVDPARLDEDFTDCCRRGIIGDEDAGVLRDELAALGLLAPQGPLPGVERAWAEAGGADAPVTPRSYWE